KGTGWTIENGVGHSDGTGNLSTLGYGYSSSIVQGKTYEVTFTVTNYVSGAVRVVLGTGIVGSSRSSNGTFTENIVAGVNGSFAFQTNTSCVGDVDNVTIKQVDISASSEIDGSELLVDGDREAENTHAWNVGNSAILSKETTNPHGGT